MTGSASRPGGSAPRAISARTQSSIAAPASSPRRSRWPTPHSSQRRRARRVSASATSSLKSPTLMSEPLAQERARRALDEPHEVVELQERLPAGRAAGRAGTASGSRVGLQRARALERHRVEAPRCGRRRARRGRSCAGRTAAAGGGRRRGRAPGRPSVRTVAVDDVEQLVHRHGRRALGVRALVVARVGDDEPVGRREQRVEQELAVLAARVAVADVRVARA